jgi:hypothetical protein
MGRKVDEFFFGEFRFKRGRGVISLRAMSFWGFYNLDGRFEFIRALGLWMYIRVVFNCWGWNEKDGSCNQDER